MSKKALRLLWNLHSFFLRNINYSLASNGCTSGILEIRLTIKVIITDEKVKPKVVCGHDINCG